MTASMIDVVHHGPIALVTLRRPPANAMNLELTEDIAEDIATVFQHLGQDRSVRSLVLTAAAIAGQTSSHSLRTASLALSSAGVPSNTMRPWPIT